MPRVDWPALARRVDRIVVETFDEGFVWWTPMADGVAAAAESKRPAIYSAAHRAEEIRDGEVLTTEPWVEINRAHFADAARLPDVDDRFRIVRDGVEKLFLVDRVESSEDGAGLRLVLALC